MRRLLAVISALAACIAIGACGSSDSNSDTATSAGASTSAATSTAEEGAAPSEFLKQNTAAVDEWLSPTGTFAPPPTTSPKPEAGKRIALISCGQVIATCQTAVDIEKGAAESIGWSTTVIDATNGDPVAAGPGIRNAVAQGVDGIFSNYIDCQYIKGPLQAAKDAGIPVINSLGFDCNQTDPDAEPLFTESTRYNVGDGSYSAWLKAWAESQAGYAIDKLDGNAQIAYMTDNTSQASVQMAQWGKSYVSQCDTCKMDLFLFPISDITTKLQGKAEAYLLKNQDINSVIPGYTALLPGGLQAALQSAQQDLLVSVNEGQPEGIALIRDGKAQYGSGLSYPWEAYAGIDTLNRLFHGEKGVNSGIGTQLFDEEHNFPTGDTYQAPYDVKALYEKAWGVGQ